MSVHNENYKEIIGLLGNMYVKYIDINNSVTSRSPFVKKIFKDISNDSIVDSPLINGVKKSLYGQDLTNDDDIESGAKYNINNDSFTSLINQVLYTEIANIVVEDKANIDNLANTKGYLKFAKGNKVNIENQVSITSDDDNIFNLICSMNLVNVFIDILEAYNNFLNNNSNITHLKKNVNNIIIVNKYARDVNNNSDKKNYGYWVNGDNTSNKMRESTLFLSIDSYEGASNNKLFDDFRVKYNGYGNFIEGNGVDGGEITTTSKLFNEDIIQNGGSGSSGPTNTLSGIVLKKKQDGRGVIGIWNSTKSEDIYLDDINDSSISESNLQDALLKRDKRLLLELLNTILNLDLINRKTQISGLLKIFKVIREYFYIAITTGNLLYNSVYNKTTITDDPISCTITPTASTCAFTFYKNGAPEQSTGFGIKYLDKDDLLSQSIKIYNNTFDNDDVLLTTSSVQGQDKNNSMFGLAFTANKEEYIPNIIEKISDLHTESAKTANISNADSFVISKYGFIAETITKRTIRIKTRRGLFKKVQNDNDNDELTTTKKSNNDLIISEAFYINTESYDSDITYNKQDTKTNDKDEFQKDDIINSELPVRIKNQLRNKKMGIATTHVILINNSTFQIENIEYDGDDIEFVIRARLLYPSLKDPNLKDVPVLTLPYDYVTLFTNNTPIGTNSKSDSYFGTFNKDNMVYFQATDDNSNTPGYDNKVSITVKKPLDYKTGYINNVDAINNINNQINSNQSKIKNIKTLYDLNKSKNNVLYYQLIAYIVLLLGIIITLGLTYTMKMEKGVIKLVSSVCFGIVVLQVVSYYILGVLYIESFTPSNIIENFNNNDDLTDIQKSGQDTTEFTADGNNDHAGKKIAYVNNQLLLLNSKIIKAIELSNVGVGQGDATDAYTTLLGNTSSERDKRSRVNSILSSESDSSIMHIDLLKYSASVYGVYIKTVLMFSLAITALFTINLYTDNKYMENIAFVGTFILVVIFAYYLIYSNSVVRTKSNNIYWGKEYKTQYTDFK